MITSTQNPRIKHLLLLQQKSAQRKADGLVVVEGRREVEHCLSAGFTIRTAFVCEEIADCIRSCAVKGGHFDRKGAEALLNGYQSVSEMSEVALENIRRAFEKINFELALRYYTDAIAKNKSFKEKYPGYLLEKARRYFAILQ